MTKKEMLKEVDKKVQNWLWKEYIPGFDSRKDMANNAIFFAAVTCMADMIHNYVCDPENLETEENIDSLFYERWSLQEFYDFFTKHNMTLNDIAEAWLRGDNPDNEDILGLRGWGSQLDDVLFNIHWLLKYIKRKEVSK